MAWPLRPCPHCSLEAELHPLPQSLPADACSPLPGAAHKLVCYFTNWAHNRPGPASIWPRDLDPFLCTHLVFAFASMNDNQLVPKDLQDERILYPEFNKLKERCVCIGRGGHAFRLYRSRRIKPFLLFLVNIPPILRVSASPRAGLGSTPELGTPC